MSKIIIHPPAEPVVAMTHGGTRSPWASVFSSVPAS